MSLKPTKVYPVSMQPGESVQLLVQGSYFKIASSTGVLDVTGDTFGTIEGVLAGQGLRGYPFQRLTLRDRSGVGNVVRLLVADELFIDDRITGSVEVIDGGRNRSMVSAAFSGVGYSAAVAGMKAHVQLYNPPGSGRRLVVKSVKVIAYVGSWNADLRMLNSPLAGTVNAPACKMLGGASGVAQLRDQANAGLMFSGESLMTFGGASSGSSDAFRFEEPILIGPGKGMVVFLYQENATLQVPIEWFEEPNE